MAKSLHIAIALLLSAGCAHGIGPGEAFDDDPSPDAGNKFDDPRPQPDAAPASIPCSGGAVNFEDPATGNCYIFFDQKRDWDFARGVCENLGAGVHLATIDSDDENQLIATLVGGADAWLGGTDAGDEGNWIWENGDDYSYEGWRSGEPNNGNGSGEDCMVVEGGKGGTWDDRNCGNDYRYVCEVPGQ